MALPYLSRIDTDLQVRFESGIRAMASRLGVLPEWIALTMYRESGLKPSAYNGQSGASGLIQFLPSTAKGLGTTTKAIRAMNAVQQLPYVEKYLSNQLSSTRIHPTRLVDLYLLVLYPKGAGKPSNYIVFRRGTNQYAQNRSLNPNGDVTVADVEKFVNQIVPLEWQSAAVKSGLALGGLAVGAGFAYLMYFHFFNPKHKRV